MLFTAFNSSSLTRRKFPWVRSLQDAAPSDANSQTRLSWQSWWARFQTSTAPVLCWGRGLCWVAASWSNGSSSDLTFAVCRNPRNVTSLHYETHKTQWRTHKQMTMKILKLNIFCRVVQNGATHFFHDNFSRRTSKYFTVQANCHPILPTETSACLYTFVIHVDPWKVHCGYCVVLRSWTQSVSEC